jgi:hypothetical protein
MRNFHFLHQGTTFGIAPSNGELALPTHPKIVCANPEAFEKYGFKGPESPTPVTRVKIFSFEGTARASELIGAFAQGKPENLCLTRAQIPLFIQEHLEYLAPSGVPNLFVVRTESDGHPFFALCDARRICNNCDTKVYLLDLNDPKVEYISANGSRPRLFLPASVNLP